MVSLLALVVAGSGVAYAATLPRNSVDTPQLRNGAVTSAKVEDRTLTARDFNPGVRLRGPAGPRGATGPTGPTGPSTGYGAYHDAYVEVPSDNASAPTTILSLSLPAGSYVVSAKAVVTIGTANNFSRAACKLSAPSGDFDESYLEAQLVGSASREVGTLAFNLGTYLGSSGSVHLTCNRRNPLTPTLTGADYMGAARAKITAVKVGTVGNVPG